MGDSITSNLVDSFRCPTMKLRETCHEIDWLYPVYSVPINEQPDEHGEPFLRSFKRTILVSHQDKLIFVQRGENKPTQVLGYISQ